MHEELEELTVSRLDALVERVQLGVRMIEGSFTAHDDDWDPVLFLEDGEGQVTVAALMGEFFENNETKDRARDAMIMLMREQKAVRFVALFSCWMTTLDDTEPRVAWKQPGERKEVLLLIASDADEERGLVAEITRDGTNPPVLGEFGTFGGEDAKLSGFTGRFADLAEGLR